MSLGMVVILPLMHISSFSLTISLLKELIPDKIEITQFQFSVYIHNLMFGFILERVF